MATLWVSSLHPLNERLVMTNPNKNKRCVAPLIAMVLLCSQANAEEPSQEVAAEAIEATPEEAAEEASMETAAEIEENATDESAKEAVEKAENSCGPITCSNHGVCVVKRGEPMCACEEGFAPDPTTGLSCQPAPSGAAETSPSLTFEQEQREIQVALQLKAPPDAGYCLRYETQYPDKHCVHFWYDYYSRKKRSSLLVLIPGILGIGAGAAMGLVVDPIAGVAIGGGGIILTTIGAIMLARNVRRVKNLFPLVMKYSDANGNDKPYAVVQPQFRWEGATFSIRF